VHDPLTVRSFDRRANIGLYHLSRAGADDATLQAVWDKVSARPEIAIDVPPGPIRAGPAVLSVRCELVSAERFRTFALAGPAFSQPLTFPRLPPSSAEEALCCARL
jgi:hypothetical protein